MEKVKEIFVFSKFTAALLIGAAVYYAIVFTWNRDGPNDDRITALAFLTNYLIKFILVKYWVFKDKETAHAGIQLFWYLLLGTVFTLMTNYLRNSIGMSFSWTQAVLFPITWATLFIVSKKIFKYPTKIAEESL